MSSRGDQLSQEAETLLKKKPFFGKDKHNIHVADKFKQAGNAYKTDRVWKRAGECHDHSGQIYSQNKEEKSGIDEYIEAAKCYEKDPECYKQAVSSYKNAASLLSKNEARAFEAGNCLADAGQVLLKANKIDDGLNLLEDAAKTLKNAKESNANVAKIYEQIADMLSDKGQYMKAVDFYQNVIQIRLGNSLTQGSAGIVFFKANSDNLVFAASVGNPDASSDEYVPLVLKISPNGTLSVSKDTQLDTGANDSAEE